MISKSVGKRSRILQIKNFLLSFVNCSTLYQMYRSLQIPNFQVLSSYNIKRIIWSTNSCRTQPKLAFCLRKSDATNILRMGFLNTESLNVIVAITKTHVILRLKVNCCRKMVISLVQVKPSYNTTTSVSERYISSLSNLISTQENLFELT